MKDDYQADSDASTLQRHAEITSDPKRHAAAHAKLLDKQSETDNAVASSGKALKGKVKKGLAKAFPKDTPYQQAGKSGGTPYDKAGKGD